MTTRRSHSERLDFGLLPHAVADRWSARPTVVPVVGPLVAPVSALRSALDPRIEAGRADMRLPIESIEWEAAMRELVRVHRVEQARLLVEASRLRCVSTPVGRVFSALCGADGAASAWRRDASEELDACLLDGWEVPEALMQCVSRSTASWRSARSLARAALALEPSLAARAQLARADLCEGSLDDALVRLQELAVLPMSARRQLEVLQSLALAAEAGGRWALARETYAALCRCPESGPAARAAWLALALRTGDLVQAARARALLLEASASACEAGAEWTAALSRLRARIRFHRALDRWEMSSAAQRWIREWIGDPRADFEACAEGREQARARAVQSAERPRMAALRERARPRPPAGAADGDRHAAPARQRAAEIFPRPEICAVTNADWPAAIALALL